MIQKIKYTFYEINKRDYVKDGQEIAFPLISFVLISLVFNWVISLMMLLIYWIIFESLFMIFILYFMPAIELIYSFLVLSEPKRICNSKYLILKKITLVYYLATNILIMILPRLLPSWFIMASKYPGEYLSFPILFLRLIYDLSSSYVIWNYVIHVKIDRILEKKGFPQDSEDYEEEKTEFNAFESFQDPRFMYVGKPEQGIRTEEVN